MGSEVVPTPADVMAKATRMLKRVMLLQMAWFLCFFAGGVLTVWTAWKNTRLPASCTSGVRATVSVIAGCEHHSYHWPVLLVVVGIAGLLVTGYVATRLAVKYLGAGAAAFLRSGRRFAGPTASRPGGHETGGQSMGGGRPGSTGGMPPGLGAGLPPGTPGSPSGPPLA
jgi:hypothetical protein